MTAVAAAGSPPVVPALATLRAVAGRGRIALYGGLAALLWGFGAAMVLPGRRDGVLVACLVFGILATVLLWGGWFARLVMLHGDAWRFRTPGVGRGVARALAMAFAATVLAPGAALAIAGLDPLAAFGSLALAAVTGLLLPLLPGVVLSLLIAAVFFTAPEIEALWRATPSLATRDFTGVLALSAWMLPVAAAVLAWRWHGLVRRAAPDRAPWLRPMQEQVAGTWAGVPARGEDLNAWRLRTPRWIAPGGRVPAAAGPARPVLAVGTLLGGHFAPVRLREQAGFWLVAAVLVGGAMLLPADNAFASFPRVALVGGLSGLQLSGFWLAWQLDAQQQRPSAEFAELALLPGLGDGAALRTALLRRLGSVLAGWHLLSLAGLAATVAIVGAGAGAIVVVAALWLAATAAAVAACLWPLAGRPLLAPLPVLALVAGGLVGVVGAIALLHGTGDGRLRVGSALASLAAAAVYTAAARSAWRALRRRPHPFLLR